MPKLLQIEDIQVHVRIANHHPVEARTVWQRSIPDLQFICFLEGEFEYTDVQHPPLRLTAGDVLFIQPTIMHRLSILDDCAGGAIATMHVELAAGSWADGDYRLAVEPARVTRVAEAGYLQERFKHLAAVYESYQPNRMKLVDAIATEIVLVLAAHWQDRVQRTPRPSQRMEAILAYIRANLAAPITRQSLAREFHLSVGYINQLFQVELGMPPSAVINRERAARAYHLIDTQGLAVAEAARAVGFEDPFYFSRVFKQIYAIPPSQVAAQK